MFAPSLLLFVSPLRAVLGSPLYPLSNTILMSSISQPLQSEALAFLDAIEQDKANAERRAAEMEQSNSDLTRQLANANDTIAKHEATIAQQQATIAQMEASSQQPAVEPKPDTEPTYSGTMSYSDPTPYVNQEKRNVATFSYARKYKTTKWGTLVLPVALDYADWKERFEIAEIVGVTVNANGTYTAKRKVLGEGSSTVPNRPYLLRAKAANANTAQVIKKQNCTVFPATPDVVNVVKIVADGKTFRFLGSYLPIDFSVYPGHYYSSGGNFVSATGSLNPMRVYLEIS